MAAALPLEKLGLTDEQERAVIAATLGVLLDSLVDGGAVHEARGAQTHMHTHTHTCVCSYYIYMRRARTYVPSRQRRRPRVVRTRPGTRRREGERDRSRREGRRRAHANARGLSHAERTPTRDSSSPSDPVVTHARASSCDGNRTTA